MKIAIFVALLGLALAEQHDVVEAPPTKAEPYSPKAPPGFKPRTNSKRAATCGTPTALTPAQATESITSHNALRAKENSDDELATIWDDEMAACAQAYANQCIWAHGMLNDCEGNRLGQNLYVSSSSAGFPPLNMTGVATAWWNERNDWNFVAASCSTGKECGHFTQLVWATSLKVGCGYANCPTMSVGGATWTNCLMVVCDYTPPGNILDANNVQEPIYETGASCSHCDIAGTGAGFKCVNNLCTSCTPAKDSTCKCGTPAQACQNGGVWSAATCSCQCGNKFFGTTCQQPCSCADLMPNDCPGWKASGFCTNPDYHDFVATNCITTCGMSCALPASCSS